MDSDLLHDFTSLRKRERRRVLALYAHFKAAAYEGGYSRLTYSTHAWREGESQALTAAAFIPPAFELAEAFQFDWSDEGLVVGGIYRRLQLAHMKLCGSRAFWLVAYLSQGHEMLFAPHIGFRPLRQPRSLRRTANSPS